AVDADAVAVVVDDLARVSDANRHGALAGEGIGEGRVTAAAFEESVEAAGVLIIPDDLARGVDAIRIGALGGRGVIESRVNAVAVEKTVGAACVAVIADDLARPVDAQCTGGARGGGIVEGRVDIDRHGMGSSMIVARWRRDFRNRTGATTVLAAVMRAAVSSATTALMHPQRMRRYPSHRLR